MKRACVRYPEPARLSNLCFAITRRLFIILVAAVVLIAIGCSSDDDSPSGPGDGSDNTPPTVSSISPAAGSTGISPNTKITVTFSEPVDPATVTNSSFTVSSVTGTITCNGAVAECTPSTALTYAQTYTVTITTDVTDTAGNALANTFTSTFTVMDASVLPVADAGEDALATAGDPVTLDGSGSSDPSSQTLTYAWEQISGPTVSWLTPVNREEVRFFTDTVATMMFELVVTAGGMDSPPDTVAISVLEDAENAIWVDLLGRSGGARGDSRVGPDTVYTTIQGGIDAAVAAGFGTDVYVAGGTYNEDITLHTGVSIYGGYINGGSALWLRDPESSSTIIMGSSVAVRGDGASVLSLDGLHIKSADAAVAGESSIAVSLNDCNEIMLCRSTLIAGTTADGEDAVQPGNAPNGNSGGNGWNGRVGYTAPGGYGGSSSIGRAGGKGGTGDVSILYDSDGQDGEGPGGGSGGDGGAYLYSGQDGDPGSAGRSYTDSVAGHGAGGLDFGSLLNGYYIPSDGIQGDTGAHGDGGGGGGSGGWCPCASTPWVCDGGTATGGGGGGGGAGGHGGYGGHGGGGAGGSFALVLTNCDGIEMFACSTVVVVPGYGGNGAVGGLGGIGGNRGSRGSEYDWSGGCSYCASSGYGGNGGRGGDGGRGGTGGGGGGGPAICILYDASSTFTELGPDPTSYDFPPEGGDGGLGSGGLGGDNEGAQGLSAMMYMYNPTVTRSVQGPIGRMKQ